MVSPTHDAALTATSLAYETLPIMDWALWSRSETEPVGMWPVLVASDGTTSPMAPDGSPLVEELNSKDLRILQPLGGGGTFSIICSESGMSFAGADRRGQPLRWAWNLVGGAGQKAVVLTVTTSGINYHFSRVNYQLNLKSGSCQQLSDGTIRLSANADGKLNFIFKQNLGY